MGRPKKNNAEYFSHDANMRDDIKIKALRRKFSHMGYAVWNYLLETLTNNDFFEIEWNEINIELLAADYDVTVEELTDIVNYSIKIGLLNIEDGKLFSLTHKQRLEVVSEYWERHWNWKGGITNERHRIRESALYKKWRVQVFERDKYICQSCGKIGGKLNAHHIKPFSVYPELRLDIDNGITLCKECHIELHKKERLW